jgi:hypothetical protein
LVQEHQLSYHHRPYASWDTDTSRDVSDVLMYLGYIPPPENLPSMIAWRSWFKDRRINEEIVF